MLGAWNERGNGIKTHSAKLLASDSFSKQKYYKPDPWMFYSAATSTWSSSQPLKLPAMASASEDCWSTACNVSDK